jgi:hypothetical protein
MLSCSSSGHRIPQSVSKLLFNARRLVGQSGAAGRGLVRTQAFTGLFGGQWIQSCGNRRKPHVLELLYGTGDPNTGDFLIFPQL